MKDQCFLLSSYLQNESMSAFLHPIAYPGPAFRIWLIKNIFLAWIHVFIYFSNTFLVPYLVLQAPSISPAIAPVAGTSHKTASQSPLALQVTSLRHYFVLSVIHTQPLRTNTGRRLHGVKQWATSSPWGYQTAKGQWKQVYNENSPPFPTHTAIDSGEFGIPSALPLTSP